MEMNCGSSASYLARTPCAPLFCALLTRVGNRRALDYQGMAGIISIVRWVEPSPGHIPKYLLSGVWRRGEIGKGCNTCCGDRT